VPDDEPIRFARSMTWDLGEWTDDTAMAIPILDELAAGNDVRTPESQGRIVRRWVEWHEGAKDVGIQTRAVLSRVKGQAAQRYGDIYKTPDAELAKISRDAAALVHHSRGHSGGNGSLMRTSPIAIGYLNDTQALVEAARAVSELTHLEEDAGDGCVIWCLAIRHAVVTGQLDVRIGLTALDPERRALWAGRIDHAETVRPSEIENNGWVVAALQASVSAIKRGQGLQDTLEEAVRAGYDTDTVAAITGQLSGAQWGASAVPAEWARALHGWPGVTGKYLVDKAEKLVP
jgi:ADP-ribosylglycohydrolase